MEKNSKTEGVPFQRVQRAEQDKIGVEPEDDLLGLALSGGGIRSATFNLGVLQALARLGLLKQFEYLSTVSGGGYIGSWLSAWTARAKRGIDEVQESLGAEVEPREVKFLREYSNYLTPKLGWLSADTLTGIATYVRNMLLNLTIIVALIGALLLVPWLLSVWGEALPQSPTRTLVVLIASFAFLAIAVYAMTRNVIWQEIAEHRAEQQRDPEAVPDAVRPKAINLQIVLPLVLWAASLSLALYADRTLLASASLLTLVFGITVAIIIARAVLRLYATRAYPDVGRFDPARRFLGVLVGTLLGVGLMAAMTKLLPKSDGAWLVVVWGVPALLAALMLAVTFMLGVGGRIESEYAREWWSRLGGLLLRVVLIWIVITGAALYGHLIVERLGAWVSGLGTAWIVATVGSVLAARSPASGKEDAPRWIDLAAKIGPYVFILGLLLLVSWLLYYAGTPHSIFNARWIVLGIVVLAAIAAGLSATVDINLFSFHMFYRNRLVRCFLGASNRNRRELPFIGFDPRDNPKLTELRARPYHLVNTAINLTNSSRLGWQERKAGSFVLSPLYCGYQFPVGPGGTPSEPCYQPTREYLAGKGYLNLGTALAISGAAASPNMGYHSSPSVAFLLTIFNLRLGWWIQNPSKPSHWHRGGPRLSLRYLLGELFGFTNELTPFVYVSDGGHFDNLGLYELVRRRCRFIVVSDASCDGKFQFEDLGSAIRKCQIDFDCSIEIGQRAVIPDPATGRSRYHCAVGKIRYKSEDGKPTPAPGYLLYIKPSLSGNEPSDVLQYKAAAPDFPHESTQDQWFSESQFESYRKLGFHVAYGAMRDAGITPGTDRESMFVALSERWFPPASSGAAAFARHTAQLKQLEDTLRSDPNLRFLDFQIYPEWERLAQGAQPVQPATQWLPQEYDRIRAGFHFCSTLLQLTESVYLELNLEDESEHPDHRGWMNLFQHWAWSGMFRVTYSVCCATFGARFQRFCERHLELRTGELSITSYDSVAAAGQDLNPVEIEIIKRLDGNAQYDQVHVFKIAVSGPMQFDGSNAERFVYPFGFALTRGKAIVYFRIQDHVRRMSHARRALSRLYHHMGFRTSAVDEVRKVKDRIDWLEPQDFAAFDQLFRSVAKMKQDYEETRAAMQQRDRAFK